MSDQPTAGERLRREFRMKGILTLPPEEGGAAEVLCDMEDCYCPRGRAYFDPLGVPLTDWMPSEDHYPKLRMFGGTRKLGNIRLAHRACNRLAHGWQRGHLKQRWKAAMETLLWHREEWRESASNAEERGLAEEKWRSMRAKKQASS